MNFLVQKDNRTDEKDRKLFGGIAHALISKAARFLTAEQAGAHTRTRNALTDLLQAQTNTLGITTPEELSLLVQVYIANGHASDAAKLLWSIWVLKTQLVRGNDPDQVTTLLFDAAHASGKWSEAVSLCQNLLELQQKAGKDPDGRIWNLLVKAAEKGDPPA
jgi:hypothetical protein